jgi:glycosyltransferase involved in cell wall biosynthesis
MESMSSVERHGNNHNGRNAARYGDFLQPRVLIQLPCLVVGGTEMHTLMLARTLMSGGYGVTICAYYEHDRIMVDACEAAGARVRTLGLDRNAASRNLGRMPQLASALSRTLREERPHFVHVQYMTPTLVPLLVARRLAPRLLATVHVPAHHYGARLARHRIIANRVCDAFLCNSQVVERSFFDDSALFDEALLRRGRRHFAIPNCVDLEEVDRTIRSADARSLRESLGLQGRRVVGMLSRLSPEKGARELVDAMSLVAQQLPDAALLIVGDGCERPALQAQSDRLGISAQVRFVGRLPRREALRHMAVMDVVAVPSHWEGFGLSAAEAMACRKPVVATNVDGLREVIIPNATGLLVPRGDTRALAKSLIRLLRDPQLRERLGDAGRKRIEQHFSFTEFAARHLRLYAALDGRSSVVFDDANVGVAN